jgi:tRNA-specific 2-thiouridylase
MYAGGSSDRKKPGLTVSWKLDIIKTISNREMKAMERVLVAMSGGVDSSVAAFLLKEAGYDCIGATMRLFDGEDPSRGSTCCSLDDVEDAKSVCRRLGIPHYTFNFTGDFAEKVIAPFVRSYENGRTPNPCIDCNRYLKFERLYHRAMELGCDYIATGHYVRRELLPSGEFVLKKALDQDKEQSYVLYSMTQEQLAKTLFPLGALTKPQVREIAEREGFLNAKKHDSQDICFVPDGDYAAFIEGYTGKEYAPGDVLDTTGEKLGTHRGIIHYTIGQRKGLGLALGTPMYVKATDPVKNTVILGKNEELFSTVVYGENLNWISTSLPQEPISVTARVRYHQKEQPALLEFLEDGTVRATFQSPQRAVTPGQAIVFYQGDTVLGGAEITSGS